MGGGRRRFGGRERGDAARRDLLGPRREGRLRPRDDLRGLVRGAAQRLASARGDFRERRALGGRGVSRAALMESAASSREAVAAAGVQSTASSDSV